MFHQVCVMGSGDSGGGGGGYVHIDKDWWLIMLLVLTQEKSYQMGIFKKCTLVSYSQI